MYHDIVNTPVSVVTRVSVDVDATGLIVEWRRKLRVMISTRLISTRTSSQSQSLGPSRSVIMVSTCRSPTEQPTASSRSSLMCRGGSYSCPPDFAFDVATCCLEVDLDGRSCASVVHRPSRWFAMLCSVGVNVGEAMLWWYLGLHLDICGGSNPQKTIMNIIKWFEQYKRRSTLEITLMIFSHSWCIEVFRRQGK